MPDHHINWFYFRVVEIADHEIPTVLSSERTAGFER
jgi:hypothetical protein